MSATDLVTAAAPVLASFLAEYLRALQRARGVGPVQPVLEPIRLAEAALRLQAVSRLARPWQLAFIGPTQTGKSTLVNAALGRDCAAVSPLAGFTVQPQGFFFGAVEPPNDDWQGPLLPGWPRLAPRRLLPAPLEQVGFETLDFAPPLPLPAAARHGLVAWDTPDFDSVAAGAYRGGVLEIVAQADAVILVVSKEKYADLAVWEMLGLLAPLAPPLLVCLNKAPDDGANEITAALRKRLDDLGDWGRATPVCALPYLARLDEEPERFAEAAAPLRADIVALLDRVEHFDPPVRLKAWLTRDWERLCEPLRLEHAAIEAWRHAVGEAAREGLARYRRDFLEDAQRYDGLRRVTIDLLRLLELPGVGPALGAVRNVLTWPARRVYSWGRSLARGNAPAAPAVGELPALADLIDRTLTRLEHEAAAGADALAPGAGVWRAIGRRLRQLRGELQAQLEQAAAQHVSESAREIHRTAEQLHEYLKQRPPMLNSLRAARALTDAASIAVAIKTGGAVGTDLLLAPALFGLTSALTEGTLSAYMNSLAAELKERQLNHAKTTLFDGEVAGRLRAVSDGLNDAGVLGLSAAALAAAWRDLDAWSPR